MNIYYQGVAGAYSHKASLQITQSGSIPREHIKGLPSFKSVFDHIDQGHIGVLPIENSYAGSIHENFYHLISGQYKIIGEIYLDINHYLVGLTHDISTIKDVYSHPQALMQCSNYLSRQGFTAIDYADTAGAAEFVSQQGDHSKAAIASDLVAELYQLNILDQGIQDQQENTTRFFVVVSQTTYLSGTIPALDIIQSHKTSITYKTNHTPSSLYKCLGAFATRGINLSKIESLPAKQNRFEYRFWIDFDSSVSAEIIDEAIKELQFFSEDYEVIGIY